MEIIKARVMGFCYGVKRAIKIATAAAEKNGSAVTLGLLFTIRRWSTGWKKKGFIP